MDAIPVEPIPTVAAPEHPRQSAAAPSRGPIQPRHQPLQAVGLPRKLGGSAGIAQLVERRIRNA